MGILGLFILNRTVELILKGTERGNDMQGPQVKNKPPARSEPLGAHPQPGELPRCPSFISLFYLFKYFYTLAKIRYQYLEVKWENIRQLH